MSIIINWYWNISPLNPLMINSIYKTWTYICIFWESPYLGKTVNISRQGPDNVALTCLRSSISFVVMHSYQALSVRIFSTRGKRNVYPVQNWALSMISAALICGTKDRKTQCFYLSLKGHIKSCLSTASFIIIRPFWGLSLSVLEIPTGPPVQGWQLWRRTGTFLLIFLQFYVYDMRFKAWGPTTFLQSFKHWSQCKDAALPV